MRGTVAKRLRRRVVADMPGQGSELVGVVVRRGPNRMRKLRAQRARLRGALVAQGVSVADAAAMVPDPRPNALMAVTRGPRGEYRRRKRAYTRGR